MNDCFLIQRVDFVEGVSCTVPEDRGRVSLVCRAIRAPGGVFNPILTATTIALF